MKLITFLIGALTVAATFDCMAATIPFTQSTAPDAASVRVLQKSLVNIWGNAPANTDRQYAIHVNFSQVVEQNFARLDKAGATTLIDSLSDKELSDLAQLYVSSNADSGHKAELLAVLASRLDTARLARLSRHFGYAPVYEAVINNAPTYATAFALSANVSNVAPVPHALTVGTSRAQSVAGRVGPGTMAPMQYGQYANLTPFETYLSMRTAPTGALGVSGALLETTIVWSGAVYVSWTVGTKIGNQLEPVIETYAPGLYDAIGGTLSSMYDQYRDASSQVSAGNIEAGLGALFGVTGTQNTDMSLGEGDYGSTMCWASYSAYVKHMGDGCSICQSPGPSPD